MPDPRPELVFVNGPQKNQRAVLMSNVAVLGRSPTAEVLLKEEFASRQHVRFELTRDGWMIEGLSSHGIRVNGKKYKAGRKLILDTGDVVGVGMETEILFVSAGDDPEAALAAYHEKNPSGTQMVELDEAEAPPGGAPPLSPAPVPVPAPAAALRPGAASAVPKQQVTAATEAADAEAALARARTAKVKKYGIGFAVYAVVMVVVILVLRSFSTKEAPIGQKDPNAMTEQQIEETLKAPFKLQQNPYWATKMLTEARKYYANYRSRLGNLYKAVKCFKLHLAYKGSPAFSTTEDEDQFVAARTELIRQVKEQYRRAWTFEKAQNWYEAKKEFDLLLEMIPATYTDQDLPNPEPDNPLFKNIVEHLTYINNQAGKKR